MLQLWLQSTKFAITVLVNTVYSLSIVDQYAFEDRPQTLYFCSRAQDKVTISERRLFLEILSRNWSGFFSVRELSNFTSFVAFNILQGFYRFLS